MTDANNSNRGDRDRDRRSAAKAKKAKEKAQALPSFADLGIDDTEAAAALAKCEEQLREGDRNDVESTFLKGAAIAEGRMLCGSQKVYEAWTGKRCNLTRRGAENYKKVHVHLSGYRDRLIAIGMLRSSMYELAEGSEEKVEAVLDTFEAGTKMTAAQIKAFVDAGLEAEPVAEPADMGGPEGIKAMARLKLSVGLPILMKRLQSILAVILEELDRHALGKRVSKGQAADRIEHEARRAKGELASLIRFVEPNPHGPAWLVHPADLPAGSGWSNLDQLLYKLGGREQWPAAGELGEWLSGEVVMGLEWALGPRLVAEVRKADEARLAAAAAKVAPKRKRGGAKVEGEAASRGKGVGASAEPGKSKPKAVAPGRGRKKVAAGSTEVPLVPELSEETSAPIATKA